MNRLCGVALLGTLAFAPTGCGGHPASGFVSELQARGRADLHCADVHISPLGAGGYRMRGCGRYQSYTCRRPVGEGRLGATVCVPSDTGGVDPTSLADARLAEGEAQLVVSRVGSALAECARTVEILAIAIDLDQHGRIVGGRAEHLTGAQGECLQRVLEPLVLPATGRAHTIEVVVSNVR
jgi:hypothetical protein